MKNTIVIGFIVSTLTMLVSAQTSMPPAIYVKAASIGTELARSFEQRPTLGIGTINRGDDYNIVSVGDAILIPEGTPHQYTAVEGVVGYLEVRFKTAQY